MSEDFELTLCDDPDYGDLIAEIYFNGEFVGIVSQESGYESLDLSVHPRKNGEPWQFKLKEFEAAIQKARTRLWELRKREGGGG
jgi:hypothetical protein